jgi:mono/diheme cytochrome c family protein
MNAGRLSWALRLVGLVVVAAAVPANAQDSSAVQRGDTKFQRSCAPCHGPGRGDDGRAMLPGTTALQLKYKGTLPAALEARTDLTAPILRTFVRRGSWSMPPFRKTELSDPEINDIAAYLATSSKAAVPAARK